MKTLTKRLFALSIRTQILLLVLAVAIPAGGLTLFFGAKMRTAFIADARLSTQSLADNLAAENQNRVAAVRQLLMVLAQLPEVKNQNRAKIQTVLLDVLKMNANYSNIFIADRSGHVWASALPQLLNQNVSDRRYFIEALKTGQLSSGEYVISRATSRPAFNFAYPVRDGSGAIIGIISVGLVLEAYNGVLERAHLPEGTGFLLLDHNGTVVYRSSNAPAFIGRRYDSVMFEKMAKGPETETLIGIQSMAGDRRIVTYRKLFLPGEEIPFMYIRAGIPMNAVMVEVNRLLLRSLGPACALFILALVLVWLVGARTIAGRVTILEKASRKLAQGDLVTRIGPLVAGGELGRLGQTFDEMAGALQERLREKDVLIHEIHHRVKNNMQVIASLLRLQAGSVPDPLIQEAFSESQRRILAMALVHDKLYRSPRLDQIKVGDYVRSLTAALSDSFQKPNISFEYNIPDISLEIDRAIPCGLIINELVTNSFKYAFPDNRQGVIRIGLDVNSAFTLTVEDTGIGLPASFEPAKISSLGLRLVSMLVQQLHGEFTLRNSGGTAFKMTFGQA